MRCINDDNVPVITVDVGPIKKLIFTFDVISLFLLIAAVLVCFFSIQALSRFATKSSMYMILTKINYLSKKCFDFIFSYISLSHVLCL